MLRRRFLSTLAALPFAGRLVKAGPTMPRCVVDNVPKLAEAFGGPSMHWATPHSTPLADIMAMRERFQEFAVPLQGPCPVAVSPDEFDRLTKPEDPSC